MSKPDDSTVTRPPFLATDGTTEAPAPYVALVYSEGLELRDSAVGAITPPLAGRSVVIGRRPDAQAGERAVAISFDQSASRRHARVEARADGAVVVEDLGSRNGTWVDGERVSGPTPLEAGQVVRVGGTLWVAGRAPLVARERLLRDAPPPAWMAARSPAMLQLWEGLRRLAPSDLPVLLTGEMGTGKTRLAEQVHRLGPTAAGPFVAYNCSAIPHHLEEATLFGVAPGFIPTVKQRDGLLTRARGGTLFLDELGDMPALAQAKLLDAFDSREPGYVPVGGSRRLPTQCRLVSATNRDVYALGRSGDLRSDLVSRLVVGRLQVPPLRERREDLLAIYAGLLEGRGATASVARVELAEALLLGLWSENVRGLEGLAARVALGEALTPGLVAEHAGRGGDEAAAPVHTAAASESPWPPPRRELLELLARHGWKVAELARALGRRRETVSRRVSSELGGRVEAQRLWRVWKASGRLPEQGEIDALYTAYVEAPDAPGADAVRARWEAGA